MSNPEMKIEGIIREQSGKGHARKLRKSGFVPAVVYSGGKKAISFATSPKEATKILLGPQRRNTLISLELKDAAGKNKQTKKVMVRDLQVDFVMRDLQHIDFTEVDVKKPVSVMVPVISFGKCKSVVAGGQLEQVRHKIKIKCLPALIPEKISFDVTDIPFGSTHSSEIGLPAKVELAEDPMMSVITIKHPRGNKDEEETATERETPVI